MSSAKDSKNYVLFIDVLYAVVVGETIFQNTNDLFQKISMSTFSLIVIYCSIITSFIFWHKGISEFAHKNANRFFIDVIVLITYIAICTYHSSLNVVFFGFVVLYSLYLLWDTLTIWDYGEEASRFTSSLVNLGIAFGISVLWFILFRLNPFYADIIALSCLLIFIVVSQIHDINQLTKIKKRYYEVV